MKSKNSKDEHPVPDTDDKNQKNLEGYPLYPPADDIYNRSEKEGDIIEEDTVISPDDPLGSMNEGGTDGDFLGGDLDIPGSELDDEREMTGNEDEENNYYSLGGDNHNDLEEDQGDD